MQKIVDYLHVLQVDVINGELVNSRVYNYSLHREDLA